MDLTAFHEQGSLQIAKTLYMSFSGNEEGAPFSKHVFYRQKYIQNVPILSAPLQKKN